MEVGCIIGSSEGESAVPHSMQNFVPSGQAQPQVAQIMGFTSHFAYHTTAEGGMQLDFSLWDGKIHGMIGERS